MSRAYYNENDPKAAAWLRELIKANLIAPGDVDERSITDVQPNDLEPYTQCHFFAGIGGWSYALRLAGVPDDAAIWTGSCPCQPFSCAGKQAGEADERHLWPVFRNLIKERNPASVFGEQVASKLGRGWLSRVRVEMEELGYAFGAADLCAAGISAPHIRQRLYWMAHASSERRQQVPSSPLSYEGENGGRANSDNVTSSDGENGHCRVADSNGRHASEERQQRSGEQRQQPEDGRTVWMGDTSSERLSEQRGIAGASREEGGPSEREAAERTGSPVDSRRLGDSNGSGLCEHAQRDCESKQPGLETSRWTNADRSNPWAAAELIHCLDGKARRIEPGSFPLANGVPGRVGLLRGYGNAIVPQVAATFIQASLEAIGELPRQLIK